MKSAGKRQCHLLLSLLFGLILVEFVLFSLAGQPQLASAANCDVPAEYPTIQQAIEDPACGTIVIAAGTYMETLVITRSVSLKGQGSNATILDGQGVLRPVTIDGSFSQNQVVVALNDLRITNGDATATSNISPGSGGGLLVFGGAILHAEKLHIDNNLASSSFSGLGGGLALDGASAHITDTVIISNTANKRPAQSVGSGIGGGLYLEDGILHLIDSQIKNNFAGRSAGENLTASGGGLHVGGGTTVYLVNNLWEGNVARGEASEPCEFFDCAGDRFGDGGGAVGVHFSSGEAIISMMNDTFLGNIANEVITNVANSGRGGAISFNTATDSARITATLTGITMLQNVAARRGIQPEGGSDDEGRGGAIYARHTSLRAEKSLIFDNLAAEEGSGSGGGIYFHVPLPGDSLELENSILAGNIACYSSGCGDGAQVYIDYSVQFANTARIVFTTLADGGLNPGQGIFYTTPFDDDMLYITNTVVASHDIGIENHNPPGRASARYILFHGNISDHVGTAFPDTIGHVPGNPDPLFIDPEDDDYHLRSGSPAIDSGTNAGIDQDLDGDSRPQGIGFDLGADEFLFLPPTETPTVTPSPTPNSSSTPTVAPTSTPPGKKVFLPLVLK